MGMESSSTTETPGEGTMGMKSIAALPQGLTTCSGHSVHDLT